MFAQDRGHRALVFMEALFSHLHFYSTKGDNFPSLLYS